MMVGFGCATGARFFVARPPQNDTWVEGEGRDWIPASAGMTEMRDIEMEGL